MSDAPRDDEILGRALARAIETQGVDETPYDASRIAAGPAGRGLGLWQLATIAATIVVFALGFVSWFTRPVDTPPVAASPSATSTLPHTVATPVASQAPGSGGPMRVFFVRDLLPPVSTSINVSRAETRADSRISERLSALWSLEADAVPAGATNPLALVGRSARSGSFSLGVQVAGDTATLEFELASGWNVHGAAQVQALVQQIVYNATEEPGIRKARIVEHSKTSAVIDGLVVDRPLTREDVTDYGEPGSTQSAQGYGVGGNSAVKLNLRATVDAVAPALARIVIESDLRGGAVHYPDFRVDVLQNDETANPAAGKWRLVVTTTATDAATGTTVVVDRSPLRSITITTPKCVGCTGTIYDIGLDDLRPWRTAIAWDPFRIIIDIGGDPRTISGSNGVYGPVYDGVVGRSFEVTGIAHNFEANVDIRVRDEREKEILRTHTTAAICCDPGGTFLARIELPANVKGRVYLEVFEASAKDGSDTKVIRIPLTVP